MSGPISKSREEEEYLRSLGLKLSVLFDDFSYRDLKAVGVGSAQIRGIRRGDPINFTLLTLRKLAHASGLTVPDLLPKEGPNP